MIRFYVYTDGGCIGNRRDAGCVGGYGFIILDENMEEVHSGGGRDENVTNNIMEMRAVIRGVKRLKRLLPVSKIDINNVQCIVKTDSRYISDNYYEYVPTWKKNGWRKRNGGAVLNRKLWMEIDGLSRGFRSFRISWVKGHDTDPYNNRVDEIATIYMKGKTAHSQ